MKSLNVHKEEYAINIAKLYLQNAGIETIYPGPNKAEDFIINQNSKLNRQITVDVKASKYSLADIKREYKGLWSKYKRRKNTTLLMYINYEKRTGYFHLLGNGKQNEIQDLNVPTLKTSLQKSL